MVSLRAILERIFNGLDGIENGEVVGMVGAWVGRETGVVVGEGLLWLTEFWLGE
jgi:hypothetical protein